MNYQNPFMNPYGYGQQFMQQPVQPAAQQVVRVNGEAGARTYQIGANSSAMLLDESGTLVWLVTTDGAGYKTVSAYDIMPHKAEAPKEYTDLESRVRKLEEMIGGKNHGGTGYSSAAGQKPAESGSESD